MAFILRIKQKTLLLMMISQNALVSQENHPLNHPPKQTRSNRSRKTLSRPISSENTRTINSMISIVFTPEVKTFSHFYDWFSCNSLFLIDSERSEILVFCLVGPARGKSLANMLAWKHAVSGEKRSKQNAKRRSNGYVIFIFMYLWVCIRIENFEMLVIVW